MPPSIWRMPPSSSMTNPTGELAWYIVVSPLGPRYVTVATGSIASPGPYVPRGVVRSSWKTPSSTDRETGSVGGGGAGELAFIVDGSGPTVGSGEGVTSPATVITFETSRPC